MSKMTYDPAAYQSWLATRPEIIQTLAAEFPMGCCLKFIDAKLYIIGYCEDGSLIASAIDPKDDYEASLDVKEYLHADRLRALMQQHGGGIN